MAQQKLSWKKIASWLLGFGLGKALFDYFNSGTIDYYGVVFIPIIALVLIYFVDKKQLMGEDKSG